MNAEQSAEKAPAKMPSAEEKIAAERAITALNDNGSAEMSEWCISKLKERKLDGARNYSAYHLRQDARAQFPGMVAEVDQLIDVHFMEMDLVAAFAAKYGNREAR